MRSPFRLQTTSSVGGTPGSKSHIIQKSSPSRTNKSDCWLTVTTLSGVDSSVMSSFEDLTVGGAIEKEMSSFKILE